MNKNQQMVSMPSIEEPLTLGSAELGYQRLPFWLNSAAGSNFAWLHLPYAGNGHSTGVVICNPLGYEYTHAHRSIRHLADQLALHRYPTLRFDLHGMGDSPGDLFAEDLFDRWIAEINAAIESLKSHSGVSSICLLGIRMGATLAAKVAEHTVIDQLVLWNPVASGRRYVREMQALAWMSERARQDHDDYIESAGFIMTAALAAKIKKVNLGKQTYKINGKVLIVNRNDLGMENELAVELRQQGLAVDEMSVPGYAAMMAEPQQTEVPARAIAGIVGWLDGNKQLASRKSSGGFLTEFNHEVALSQQDTTRLIEKICLLGRDKNIFGVLSQPANASIPHAPLIVLLNSGSVHHVGPNRLYVELSRSLAAAGFSCLRIDLANLGDSVVGYPANENHCYPSHATADVEAVLENVAADLGFKQFVLAGLCSGAHTAFHVGLNNAAVCESIMINPLTFYWHNGMSLDIPHEHAILKDAKYYEGAIRNKDKWFKLLKGQVKLGYILGFIGKHLKQQLAYRARHLRAIAGLSKASRLCLDLTKYSEAQRQLSFFFSKDDPGYDILMAESPRVASKNIKQGNIDVFFVDAADHTFSVKSRREELLAKVTRHLSSRYSATRKTVE